MGPSGRSQLSLIDIPAHPQLALYAIWDPDARKDGIARLVILNLAVRNDSATAADVEAGSITIDLAPYVRKGHNSVNINDSAAAKAKVKRMTSPGLDSKDVSHVTWAGQSYANGTATGTENVESLQDGAKLTVRGSEGVLVFF